MILAAMHWNENAERPIKTDADGNQVFKIRFPKNQDQHATPRLQKEKVTTST